jgi:hypothetical protein
MSHFTSVQANLKNADCIIAALKTFGFNPIHHAEPQHLYRYNGTRANEMAEIIVPREQIYQYSNDMGFKLQGDGTYEMIVDEYTQYSEALAAHNFNSYSEFHDAFLQEYGKATVRRLAQQNNWSIGGWEKQPDGSIKSTARVNNTIRV